MDMHTAYAPEMAWESTTGFPGTAEAKVLRDEGARKARTMLVRLHAGGRATPHSHIGTVQHYVLEGEYESEGKSYGAGTYRLFPEHANVAEISTQNGVTMLMIYDPLG
jgi:hypothetical protein